MIPTNATDIAIEADLERFLIILLVALSAAIFPKIFTALRQVPYTLLLVMVGLGLALANVRLINLSPGLILFVFLPPILFEAGWNMRWADLRQEALPSALFAVGGVLVSIAGVSWALHEWMALPWSVALLTGACLSATDSASVLGLFREVGAGRRLKTLLEGESLFNDGASVVAFGVLMELAINPHPVELTATVVRFFVVCSLGVGIGGLIGICVALLSQRYELGWVEQSLTLVAAYGTYILVEECGGSGVIGVVTAGLVIGNFSPIAGIEPLKRSTMTEFWEFVTFFINSIVFLLLGDQIILAYFFENIRTTAVAILAVVASRAVAVYGFSWLSGWLTQKPIPLAEQTVLWWAGLRGAVAIALALGIPASILSREQIISNSFGVVLFTLLVQGLTTKWLLQKLGLLEDQSLHQQYLELVARRDALQQVLTHLLATEAQPKIALTVHQQQIQVIKQQLQQFHQDIEFMHSQHSQLQAFNLRQHQEQLLSIETAAYSKFMQSGLLKNPLAPMVQKAFEGNQDR